MACCVYLFEVDCVAKSYGPRRVLTSASLRLKPGTVTLLAGRNGSGKTTLVRIACGLLTADAGLVRLRGETIRRPRHARLARQGIYFMPERPLFPPGLSVASQLAAFAARFDSTCALPRVIAELGLEGQQDRMRSQMSLGELRRASLALALARQPTVLLADEPINSVAPIDAELMLRAMRRLAANGATVLVTGHQVRMLLDFVDAVTWCGGGSTRTYPSANAARSDWEFQRDLLGDIPQLA